MDNNSNDVMELLDILYGMITEAWGVPLGNDKCIIEREKAIEIINEIKTALPSSIAESKRLIAARDEFVGNAKREAENLRKSAEDRAKKLVDEQEIVQIAKARSAEMISSAEAKSNDLKRLAGDYVEGIMREANESLTKALADLNRAQGAFESVGKKNPEIKEKAETIPEADEEPDENRFVELK